MHSSNFYDSIKPNTVVKLNRESKTQYFHDTQVSKSSNDFGISVSPIFQINALVTTLKIFLLRKKISLQKKMRLYKTKLY